VKAVLFGATGMVGQGVLRELLLDPAVESVLAVVRRGTGRSHAKLREVQHADFTDLSGIEAELAGLDACFFCLGATSVGMDEPSYRRVTCDTALAAAQALLKQSPGLVFLYVSGAGTDSTGHGRTMWARIKGQTENALLRLPFAAAYMFRPGYIQPLHGVTSRTRWLRATYAVVGPLYPLWQRLFPKYVTTTERIGRAMLQVARHGAPQHVLENDDINRIATAARP
jgi:uncharacterized protein YbjT (DUF2867 family)